MKKTEVKVYLLLVILFALISVIAFSIPLEISVAFWIAYAFTGIAFATQIWVWKATLGKQQDLNLKFLGFPLIQIGTTYLTVQIAVLVVFRFVTILPAWISLIICSVVCGVSIMRLITADLGRSEIERVEANVQKKIIYIRSIQTEVELLAEAEQDETVKHSLMHLAEKIRFSDPMSHEELADLEVEIINKVTDLKTTSRKADIITEIDRLLVERNKKCKMLK